MNQQSHNKQQLLTVTNKQAAVSKLFYSSRKFYWSRINFDIKLEEKSCKMSFKALPVKIQWSKNR